MLYLVGSPAVAVILWVVGGLIVFYIALSWLELGLAIPLHYVRPARAYFWAPRSGGDKNYLEYIYKRPRLQRWVTAPKSLAGVGSVPA